MKLNQKNKQLRLVRNIWVKLKTFRLHINQEIHNSMTTKLFTLTVRLQLSRGSWSVVSSHRPSQELLWYMYLMAWIRGGLFFKTKNHSALGLKLFDFNLNMILKISLFRFFVWITLFNYNFEMRCVIFNYSFRYKVLFYVSSHLKNKNSRITCATLCLKWFGKNAPTCVLKFTNKATVSNHQTSMSFLTLRRQQSLCNLLDEC